MLDYEKNKTYRCPAATEAIVEVAEEEEEVEAVVEVENQSTRILKKKLNYHNQTFNFFLFFLLIHLLYFVRFVETTAVAFHSFLVSFKCYTLSKDKILNLIMIRYCRMSLIRHLARNRTKKAIIFVLKPV